MFFDFPIQVFFESISYPLHVSSDKQALQEMLDIKRQQLQKLRLLLEQKKKMELKNKRLARIEAYLKQCKP